MQPSPLLSLLLFPSPSSLLSFSSPSLLFSPSFPPLLPISPLPSPLPVKTDLLSAPFLYLCGQTVRSQAVLKPNLNMQYWGALQQTPSSGMAHKSLT